jgi:hypothetical protein
MLFVIPAPGAGPSTAASDAQATPIANRAAAKILHIPCPNGHQLDAPIEMLEQDVLCPHCEVQFRLHERDSVEFKQRQELAHEQAAQLVEFEAGMFWLKWAIAAAVLVAAALFLLIVLSN